MAQSVPAEKLDSQTQTELVGNLRSELVLVLQTRHSQLLVRGRASKGKPIITGLIGFADRLRLIWQAAQQDDPYADWWLIKIHDSLEALQARMRTESHQIEELMQAGRSIRIAPAEVKEPFRMKLNFSSPYAFRATRVLGDFDELVCLAFTAKHLGWLTNKQVHSVIRGCARRLRAIFNLPLGYRHLELSRKDLKDENLVYQRAKDLMGALPKDIADGSRRALYAPAINLDENLPVPTVVDDSGEAKVVYE